MQSSPGAGRWRNDLSAFLRVRGGTVDRANREAGLACRRAGLDLVRARLIRAPSGSAARPARATPRAGRACPAEPRCRPRGPEADHGAQGLAGLHRRAVRDELDPVDRRAGGYVVVADDVRHLHHVDLFRHGLDRGDDLGAGLETTISTVWSRASSVPASGFWSTTMPRGSPLAVRRGSTPYPAPSRTSTACARRSPTTSGTARWLVSSSCAARIASGR